MIPSEKHKKPTIKSIAESLGVSSATVSNAFNRPDQLSENLRQKILSTCKQVGYHGPNPTARSLRKGSTNIVGIVVNNAMSTHFSDPCAIDFFQGVAQALDEHNHSLLILPHSSNESNIQSLNSLPDRYIILGEPIDSLTLSTLESFNKPLVTVDFRFKHHLSIEVDHYQGAVLATNHMMQCTEGPLALLAQPCSIPSTIKKETPLYKQTTTPTTQRLTGYLHAAQAANRPIDTALIFQMKDGSWQSEILVASEALHCSPRPHALLCMTDQLAIAALTVARQMNIQVPQELKIIGFDGIPASKHTNPSITTIYQPNFEKGRLATKMVLQPSDYHNEVLSTHLIIRDTTRT